MTAATRAACTGLMATTFALLGGCAAERELSRTAATLAPSERSVMYSAAPRSGWERWNLFSNPIPAWHIEASHLDPELQYPRGLGEALVYETPDRWELRPGTHVFIVAQTPRCEFRIDMQAGHEYRPIRLSFLTMNGWVDKVTVLDLAPDGSRTEHVLGCDRL